MIILIAGHISSLAVTLSRVLEKEKIKVVLVGSGAINLVKPSQYVILHAVDPDDESFQEIIKAYRFDAVIYLASREENLLEQPNPYSGKMLDGLLNILQLSSQNNIKRIFYISSTEIYGDAEYSWESGKAFPSSPNGYFLESGENQCRHFINENGLRIIIVRIPNIYAPGEHNTLISYLIKMCIRNQVVTLPAPKETICNFLHADDVSDFILRVLDDSMYISDAGAINLAFSDSMTFDQVADLLKIYFPDREFQFDNERKLYTRPVIAKEAKELFDWVAIRDLKSELPGLIASFSESVPYYKTLLNRTTQQRKRYGEAIKWVELCLSAVIMQFLSDLSGAQIQFRYVDFRLLFVILMGIVYGTRFGLLASFLAGLSILLSWFRLGVDWTVLIYNVENWLPFAMYITAGVVTGYLHDKKDNEIKSKDEQNTLLHNKYEFLYGVYNEIRIIKEQFREQLIQYRDSFGRIYQIAHELDTLQEEDIFLKALTVLEDVLSNKTVAIYSITSDKGYARLEISSRASNGQIHKSINLSDYPYLLSSLEEDSIYQNTNMNLGYPAYFIPINNNGVAIASIAIWRASFEQYSLYYYNLIKVVSGLIQSSLISATLFNKSNIDKVYIPSTRILLPDAFKKVLEVKTVMKNNNVANYQLVMIDNSDNGEWEDIYDRVAHNIRAVDSIGILEDNNCYILLSQADYADANDILFRLNINGIKCELVDGKVASYG